MMAGKSNPRINSIYMAFKSGVEDKVKWKGNKLQGVEDKGKKASKSVDLHQVAKPFNSAGVGGKGKGKDVSTRIIVAARKRI